MTKQRAAILEIMRSDKCHRTAEEIFELAKQKLPNISRATVYNNLHALEEEQLVRRLATDGSVSRYDGSYVPHAHLFCTRCGGIYNFSIPDFEKTLLLHSAAEVDSYELNIKGICKACRKCTSA